MVGLVGRTLGSFSLVWLFNDFNHVSSDNSAALSALTMLYSRLNHCPSPELLHPPKKEKPQGVLKGLKTSVINIFRAEMVMTLSGGRTA